MTLKEGARAPAFLVKTDDGTRLSLASLKGKWVVIYFYPEDDTEVCTVQACSFRDAWKELSAEGIVVLGVSPDGVESHAAFRKKFRLPFTLLADEDHKVATAYGAWGTKTLYGNTFIGMHRNTVIIDPSGKVAKVLPNVRTKGHGARVLEVVREMKGE